MSLKVMKATMRHHQHIFPCHHFHHISHHHHHHHHHPNEQSSSTVMKTEPFSVIASIGESIHKCQCLIVQFLLKLADPEQHQRFVILKQEEEEEEEEPNTTNSLRRNDVGRKIKLRTNTGFSVPRVVMLQHQHLLPPSLVSRRKRTIVLDLDETLVHSTIDSPPLNYDFMVNPIFNGVTMNFYVQKRPGVDEFLEAISKEYEIMVFTAAMEAYASMVLDVLDPKGLISQRLYRDSCKQITKRKFTKDLSTIGRQLENIVIVDDNPRSYALQPANGIPIKRFVDDVEDRELEKLLGFFERDCNGFEDIRDAVKQCFGQPESTH